MTPRERLIANIQHKEPDFVPWVPWNNAQFPSKVMHIPLEIYDCALGVRDYIWFWKQQLNTDIHFGFGNVIISPNCIGVGQYNPYINHSKLNKITTETFERTGKNGRVKITLETAAGILTEKRGYAKDNSDYCTEHIFKDVEKDFEKN